MTNQEKKIKLASMREQIERMTVPAYIPGASDLEKLKAALLLTIEIILTESEK